MEDYYSVEGIADLDFEDDDTTDFVMKRLQLETKPQEKKEVVKNHQSVTLNVFNQKEKKVEKKYNPPPVISMDEQARLEFERILEANRKEQELKKTSRTTLIDPFGPLEEQGEEIKVEGIDIIPWDEVVDVVIDLDDDPFDIPCMNIAPPDEDGIPF